MCVRFTGHFARVMRSPARAFRSNSTDCRFAERRHDIYPPFAVVKRWKLFGWHDGALRVGVHVCRCRATRMQLAELHLLPVASLPQLRPLAFAGQQRAIGRSAQSHRRIRPFRHSSAKARTPANQKAPYPIMLMALMVPTNSEPRVMTASPTRWESTG